MISRFTAKIIINSLFASAALLVLSTLLLPDHRDDILEALGEEWVDYHVKPRQQEAKAALVREKNTGENDVLMALLETPRWNSTRLNDRAYRSKRKMLARLCLNLKQKGDYHALARWAAEWLSLNERNLDARAFWYEAIRHIPGREGEGLEGLVKSQHNFPDNVLLTTFLVDVYRETNNTAAAESLIRPIARDLADAVVKNWELFWITQEQKHFSQAQSRGFALSTNGDGKCSLVVTLPADATMLRVDPPPRSALRIYDIELTVNQRKKSVQISDVSREQIVQDNESLIVQQSEDPKFFIPVEVRDDEVGGKIIRVKLEFQANLIVHGVELPLAKFL